MENEKKETLVDHWLRRAKNQPVFAIVFVASIVAGSVVSLTDSVSKVSKLVWPGTSESQPQKQKPDYSRHALLWNPAFLHPVLRENTEKLRVAASEQKIFWKPPIL